MPNSFVLDAMALYKKNRSPNQPAAIAKHTPDYTAYHEEAAKLEERIAAIRTSPTDEQPKTLLESLLMLGIPVTIKQ